MHAWQWGSAKLAVMHTVLVCIDHQGSCVLGSLQQRLPRGGRGCPVVALLSCSIWYACMDSLQGRNVSCRSHCFLQGVSCSRVTNGCVASQHRGLRHKLICRRTCMAVVVWFLLLCASPAWGVLAANGVCLLECKPKLH